MWRKDWVDNFRIIMAQFQTKNMYWMLCSSISSAKGPLIEKLSCFLVI